MFQASSNENFVFLSYEAWRWSLRFLLQQSKLGAPKINEPLISPLPLTSRGISTIYVYRHSWLTLTLFFLLPSLLFVIFFICSYHLVPVFFFSFFPCELFPFVPMIHFIWLRLCNCTFFSVRYSLFRHLYLFPFMSFSHSFSSSLGILVSCNKNLKSPSWYFLYFVCLFI